MRLFLYHLFTFMENHSDENFFLRLRIAVFHKL